MLVYRHPKVVLNKETREWARSWMEPVTDYFEQQYSKGYLWVVMTGYHAPNPDEFPYFTIRGFDNDGWAHVTFHLYGPGERDVVGPYWNGGKSFGFGFPCSRPMKLDDYLDDI